MQFQKLTAGLGPCGFAHVVTLPGAFRVGVWIAARRAVVSCLLSASLLPMRVAPSLSLRLHGPIEQRAGRFVSRAFPACTVSRRLARGSQWLVVPADAVRHVRRLLDAFGVPDLSARLVLLHDPTLRLTHAA